MKYLPFFLLITLNCVQVFSQDSSYIVVKSGNRIKDVLTRSDIFLYPQFTNGKVFFRNGAKATAKLNYNSMTDQVVFIDANDDTLAIKDENTIKYIAVDRDTFYYNEGYLKLVSTRNVVKLAERRVWEVADIQKVGSHNRRSKTFAVTSMQIVTDPLGRTYDLILDEDVVIRKKPEYYFGDSYNRLVPASKKNLLLLFPKLQNSLSIYLRDNKTNFNNRDDLEKVAEFIQEQF